MHEIFRINGSLDETRTGVLSNIAMETNTLYLHLLQKKKKIVTDKLKNRIIAYLENNNNMVPTKRTDKNLYRSLMELISVTEEEFVIFLNGLNEIRAELND